VRACFALPDGHSEKATARAIPQHTPLFRSVETHIKDVERSHFVISVIPSVLCRAVGRQQALA